MKKNIYNKINIQKWMKKYVPKISDFEKEFYQKQFYEGVALLSATDKPHKVIADSISVKIQQHQENMMSLIFSPMPIKNNSGIEFDTTDPVFVESLKKIIVWQKELKQYYLYADKQWAKDSKIIKKKLGQIEKKVKKG